MATIVPDPTDNPLDRLKVTIAPQDSRITAWNLAMRLAMGDRPVIVLDHEVEHGHFFLDPCNLHPRSLVLNHIDIRYTVCFLDDSL